MKLLSKIAAFVFHPLIISTYVLLILIAANPYFFGAVNSKQRGLLVILVFLTTFIIPGVAVALMRGIGLVSSFEMRDKKERILPFIACGIFYLWMFVNIYRNPDIPILFSSFLLGATIALFIAFVINIFAKISVHAVGMGGLVALLFLLMQTGFSDVVSLRIPFVGEYTLSAGLVLLLSIVLAGFVGSSRLFLKVHTLQDIYRGYFVGFCTQLIAFIILYRWMS